MVGVSFRSLQRVPLLVVFFALVLVLGGGLFAFLALARPTSCEPVCDAFDVCTSGTSPGPCEASSCAPGETCLEKYCSGCSGATDPTSPSCTGGVFHSCEPACSSWDVNSAGVCCGDDPGEAGPFSEPEGADVSYCFDGNDNDCNGYVDCDDTACFGASADVEFTDTGSSWVAPGGMVPYSDGNTGRVDNTPCDAYDIGAKQAYFLASEGVRYDATWERKDETCEKRVLGEWTDVGTNSFCKTHIVDEGGSEVATIETQTGCPTGSSVRNPKDEWHDQGDATVDWHHLETRSCPSCSPASEICDYADNDCDNEVDEGFNAGDSCGGPGCVLDCLSDGSGTQCVLNTTWAPPDATETNCGDGIDNDCDGSLDCADSDCDYQVVPKSSTGETWTPPAGNTGWVRVKYTERGVAHEIFYASVDATKTYASELDRSCQQVKCDPGPPLAQYGLSGRQNLFLVEDGADVASDRSLCRCEGFASEAGCEDGQMCTSSSDGQARTRVDATWEWEEEVGDPGCGSCSAEVCDGLDNDCDGVVDNGFDPESCRPLCEYQGFQWTNNGGSLNCCGNDAGEDNPFEGVESLCFDGNDNDCDGNIDCNDNDCAGFGGTSVENSVSGRDSWSAPGNVSNLARAEQSSGSSLVEFAPRGGETYNTVIRTKTSIVPVTFGSCGGSAGVGSVGCAPYEQQFYEVRDSLGNVIGTDRVGETCRASCGTAFGADSCGSHIPGCESQAGESESDELSDWTWEESAGDACSCEDNDGDGVNATGGSCGPIDCDDNDASVSSTITCTDYNTCTDTSMCTTSCPAAPAEICDDGVDNDCDGLADCRDSDCAGPDNDGDLYFSSSSSSACPVDCNDSDPNNYPGNVEVCSDGADNDCDGFVDEADSACVINLTLAPSPANPATTVTATVEAFDGVFQTGSYRVSVCDYQGCDLSDPTGCVAGSAIDPSCDRLDANGLASVACSFTAPGIGAGYGYYACVGENADQELLDVVGGGHCGLGSSHAEDDEVSPAEFFHECDASEEGGDCSGVTDCNSYNYSSCSSCRVESSSGSSRLYFSCDDYWCSGLEADSSAGCQDSGSDWFPLDEVCDLVRANDSSAGPALGRGFCGYNWCSPPSENVAYLCHVNASGSPVWTPNASLPLTAEAGVLGGDAQCSDGFDNDCDGLIDCDDDGCDCEGDNNQVTCEDLGFQWDASRSPPERRCCGDEQNASWHEDDPFGVSEAGLCGDGRDNDCDNENDWDTLDRDTGDGWDSAGVHGDNDCAVSIVRFSAPNSSEAGTPFVVNCTVNSPGEFNSVHVVLDENEDGEFNLSKGDVLCPFMQWLAATPTVAQFNCSSSLPSGSYARTQCFVNTSRSYDATGPLQNSTLLTGCFDNDGDGYQGYDPLGCPSGDDCNDADVSVHPGGLEICEDGVDSNCNGNDDEACPLPLVFRVDFETNVFDTAPTWEPFNVSDYGAVPGWWYGWQDSVGDGVTSSDASLPVWGSLLGDHHDVNGVWDADVPEKTGYTVNVYTGDASLDSGLFDVYAEGFLKLFDVQSGAGEYKVETFETNVTDGTLSLQFVVNGDRGLVSGVEVFYTACDFDMDEDNHSGASCGGNDCDDTNPFRSSLSTNPYCDCNDAAPYQDVQSESAFGCDGIDNDCDGEVDEGVGGCFGTLEGYVLNQFGVGIEQALVTAQKQGVPDRNTESDVSGFYSMSLSSGNYVASARKFGFMPDTAPVSIVTGSTTYENFTLLNGSCTADCTNWEGRCDTSCEGYVDPATGDTCHFYDEKVEALCEGKLLGTDVFYGTGSDDRDLFVTCCEGGPGGGAPRELRRPLLDVEGNMKHLVRRTITSRCGAQPCKVIVFTWE